ncbi:hypothetical protein DEM27_16250 [Metarhizobium album]|uniref:Uncharacterized protein n=1 Tax=Metarhizobium album TaxID=2182425 RepID=A0A2U2DNW7_9HYPH|nr:hypothetical protein [Rhizobium album]PWE55007.1 hypothetical protein DEM27_16250 [Rhizobium album]
MARPPHGALVRAFNASADTQKILDTSTSDTNTYPKRPSVKQRADGDLTGDALVAYINGLESRMIQHMRKSAPVWHSRETRKILERWNAPHANHPAPNWAVPRDTIKEARDYAALLLKERLTARMEKLGDIRIARYLGGYKQVDPLHLIFHEKSTSLHQKYKHKM